MALVVGVVLEEVEGDGGGCVGADDVDGDDGGASVVEISNALFFSFALAIRFATMALAFSCIFCTCFFL